MGGGDLNSKKSWHPNTIKNQEKVWKAEQAQAQEKKRISELQRERAEERDHAELSAMAKRNFGSPSDNRLHWMYDKPDKKVQHEEFLLGKSIDKHVKPDEQEQNAIPAVSRRVVGSSLLSTADDVQVDLVRKMREDPLLLVKERERAARAALLNNPIHRKKITDLLRKEQELKRDSTSKKSKKKGKDLDNVLAEKLNALGGNNKLDVAALLADDSVSSDSSSDDEKKKSKKKKKKKSKKHKSYVSDESSNYEKKESSEVNSRTTKKNNLKHKSKYVNESDDSLDRKRSRQDTRHKLSKAEERCRDNGETASCKEDSPINNYKSKDRSAKYDRSKAATILPEDQYYNNSRSQESNSRRSQERTSRRSQERTSRRSRERTSRRSQERTSRRSQERSSRRSQERTSRRSRERTSRRSQERASRRSQEHSSRRSQERTNRSSQDRTSRRSQERSSGIGQERKKEEYQRKVASAESREARLAEMAAAGAAREAERGRRVRAQHVAAAAEPAPAPRAAPVALPDSLEARIHSNRQNIQRDRRHMDANFAKR